MLTRVFLSIVAAATAAATPAGAQVRTEVLWANEVLTVRATNADFRSLLQEVGRVTGVRFVAGLDEVSGRVTVDIERASLVRGLTTLLVDVDYLIAAPPDDAGTPLRVWLSVPEDARRRLAASAPVAPDADATADNSDAAEPEDDPSPPEPEADEEEEDAAVPPKSAPASRPGPPPGLLPPTPGSPPGLTAPPLPPTPRRPGGGIESSSERAPGKPHEHAA